MIFRQVKIERDHFALHPTAFQRNQCVALDWAKHAMRQLWQGGQPRVLPGLRDDRFKISRSTQKPAAFWVRQIEDQMCSGTQRKPRWCSRDRLVRSAKACEKDQLLSLQRDVLRPAKFQEATDGLLFQGL